MNQAPCGMDGEGTIARSKIFLHLRKTLPLDVDSTDSIGSIKAKVAKMEGLNGKHQELIFAGNILHDKNTLAYYDIAPDAVVDVYITDGIDLCIKIPSRGRTLTITVKKTDTILDLKIKLEEMEQIPVVRQHLMHYGRELIDDQKLTACNLKQKDTLHMTVCQVDKMSIVVLISLVRKIVVNVKSWYTIADVKLLIEDLEDIRVDHQTLFHDGKILLDNLTLQEHCIKDDAFLVLEIAEMQIFIRTGAKNSVTLMVNMCDSVRRVMDQFRVKSQVKEGIFYFLFESRVLQENMSLDECGIKRDSTLHCRFH